MVEFDALFDATYFGNTAGRWLVAAVIALMVLFTLLVLRRLIRSHQDRGAAAPRPELLELPLLVASRTTLAFLVIVAVFSAMQSLHISPQAGKVALTAFTIAAFWQIGLWTTTAVAAALDRKRRRALATDRAAASSMGIITFVARATIWSFVLLVTLDNLGVQIKPLLAGLGIGGIAIALAAQNILGDLFASLSIALDRPFIVGDALSVDEYTGTVEYIGVKSTRLRSLSGEQIIMPNANLLNSRVRNHARMRERRVVFNVSVTQQTTRTQLQRIPEILRSLIEAQEDTRFDRAHFARIAPASFDFEAVYFVTTPAMARHMDILQDINLRFIDALAAESIVLALPPQRLPF